MKASGTSIFLRGPDSYKLMWPLAFTFSEWLIGSEIPFANIHEAVGVYPIRGRYVSYEARDRVMLCGTEPKLLKTRISDAAALGFGRRRSNI